MSNENQEISDGGVTFNSEAENFKYEANEYFKSMNENFK